jgi:hypothetical protein
MAKKGEKVGKKTAITKTVAKKPAAAARYW